MIRKKKKLVAWLGFAIVSFYRHYVGLIGNTTQKGYSLLDCAYIAGEHTSKKSTPEPECAHLLKVVRVQGQEKIRRKLFLGTGLCAAGPPQYCIPGGGKSPCARACANAGLLPWS
jgi:hypothetical protein